MAYKLIKGETLKGIADAIRTKKDTTEEIPVTSLAEEIDSIEGAKDLATEFTEQDELLTAIETALGYGPCTVTMYIKFKIPAMSGCFEGDTGSGYIVLNGETQHFTADVNADWEPLPITFDVRKNSTAKVVFTSDNADDWNPLTHYAGTVAEGCDMNITYDVDTFTAILSNFTSDEATVTIVTYLGM